MSLAPLVFLNVDGVLTSARTYLQERDEPAQQLDPVAIGLVALLCKEIGAQVVMATAWVNMFSTPTSWVALFHGMGYDVPVIDVIPSEEWLGSGRIAAIQKRAGLAPFVLLDDDRYDDLPSVEVNAITGLGAADIADALRYLAPGSELFKKAESFGTKFP